MKKKTYSLISYIPIIGSIFEKRTSQIYQMQGELFHREEIPEIKEYIEKHPNDQLKNVNRFFIKGEISNERKYK